MKPSLAISTLAATLMLAGSAMASTTNSVALRWDPNSETDLAGYRVHLGTSPGTRSITRDAGLSTNFVWGAVLPGRTNYFTVTAYNQAGLESDPSNEVVFVLPKEPAPPARPIAIVTQVQTTVFQTVTNEFTVRP